MNSGKLAFRNSLHPNCNKVCLMINECMDAYFDNNELSSSPSYSTQQYNDDVHETDLVSNISHM